MAQAKQESSVTEEPRPAKGTGGDAKTEAAGLPNGAMVGSDKPPNPSSVTPVSPKEKLFTLDQILLIATYSWVLSTALFLLWWRPPLLSTIIAVFSGAALGLAFSYLYYANKRRKAETCQLLSMDPGIKGLKYLLGTLPTWINFTEREKMEWLNRILTELWPHYDRAVCQQVKDAVEPIMERYRPPGLKRIFFQQLTFGEAPFRIEGIWVSEEVDQVLMEVDVRWQGDANIILGVDLPAGGEATRLCPKLTDLVFVATLRIQLKPLVQKIPGFAAVVVSLKKMPIINYKLNFGKALGGKYSAGLIKVFIDQLLRSQLPGMLVWPKRILVDLTGTMVPPTPRLKMEIAKLMGKPSGIVRVHVISACDIKSMDLGGKSDPFVELWLDPEQHKYRTKTKRSNLKPDWNEFFYLMVKEPNDEQICICMYDEDFLGLAGQKEVMGRSLVPLREAAAQGGELKACEYPLGPNVFEADGGPGKGHGLLKLGLWYRPFTSFSPGEVEYSSKNMGAVMVRVLAARGLDGALEDSRPLKTYVDIKVGHNSKRTGPVFGTYGEQKYPLQGGMFEFYDVSYGDTIRVKVVEPSVGVDDEIGRIEMVVGELATLSCLDELSERVEKGYMHEWKGLQDGEGEIEVEMRFVPYW